MSASEMSGAFFPFFPSFGGSVGTVKPRSDWLYAGSLWISLINNNYSLWPHPESMGTDSCGKHKAREREGVIEREDIIKNSSETFTLDSIWDENMFM